MSDMKSIDNNIANNYNSSNAKSGTTKNSANS